MPKWVCDAYNALTPTGKMIVLVVGIVCVTGLVWKYGLPAWILP